MSNDLNASFKIEILDDLIEKQHEANNNLQLNLFIQNIQSLNRLNEIFLSRKFKTQYFGLTLIENLLKKQWEQIGTAQKSQILNDLMNLIQSNKANPSEERLLLIKKSASLVGAFMGKDLNFENSLQQVNTLLAQFQSESTEEQLKETYMFIFHSLADELKRLKSERQFIIELNPQINLLVKEISKSIYITCIKSLNSFSRSVQLSILNTLRSILDLLDLSLLLNSEALQLIFQKSKESYFTGTSILIFIEFINSINNNNNNLNDDNIKNFIIHFYLQLLELPIFQNLIQTNRKDLKKIYKSSSILYNNIIILICSLFKNYSNYLSNLQYSLRFEQFLVIMMPLIGADNSTMILEYLETRLTSLESYSSNDKAQLEPFLTSFFSSIEKLVRVYNIEILEDQDEPVKGVVSQVDNEIFAEWNSFSSKISPLVADYSKVLPNLPTLWFTKRFQHTAQRNLTALQSISKIQSQFWILALTIDNDPQISPTFFDGFFTLQINNDLMKEAIFIGVLYVFKTSYYVKSTQEQTIYNIIQLLVTQFLTSGKANLSEITIETLSELFKQSKVVLSSPKNLDTYLLGLAQQNDKFGITERLLLYEVIGSYLYKTFEKLPNQFADYVNQLIAVPIYDRLKSLDPSKDGVPSYSVQINYILSCILSLGRGLNNLSILMPKLKDICEVLYKWSNTTNVASSSSHQLSVKRNLIEIYEDYVTTFSSGLVQELQSVVSPFLSIISKDEFISSAPYQSEVLPRVVSFLSYYFNKIKSTQPADEFLNSVLEIFLTPTFSVISQSQASGKCVTLYSNLSQLIGVLLQNCPQYLIPQNRIANYFLLTNQCLSNESPRIHNISIQSLSQYFKNSTNILRLSDPNLKTLLLNDSILLKEFSEILVVFINSSYQTSYDELSHLLYLIIQTSLKYFKSSLQQLVNLFTGNLPTSQQIEIENLFKLDIPYEKFNIILEGIYKRRRI